MRISRRAVIAGGGAATVLPHASFADGEAPTVERVFDREDQRWGVTVRYAGKDWPLRLREFGNEATFSGIRSTHGRIVIEIAGCRFPGKAEITHTTTFELGLRDSEWRLRMEPGAWLPGWEGRATLVPLKAFMDGEGDASFGLSRARAATLCRRLFGRRIEVGSDIEARFGPATGWSLQSTDGSIVGLKDAARIRSLSLRIVRAADGHGSDLQSRTGDTTSDALVGTAALHGPAGAIATGGHPRVELRPCGPSQPRVAFRQWGDENATVALMRAAFVVTVATEGLPACEFRIADGLFSRRDDAPRRPRPAGMAERERDDTVLDRLEGVVAPKDASVATPYGPFLIRGDDLQRAETGPGAGRTADLSAPLPASGTRATIEWARGAFTAFEIRALLTHYAIALPEGGAAPWPTPGGGDPREPLWSRMDFVGTEVAFVLPPSLGRPPTARNARATVQIGRRPGPASPWPEANLSEGEAPVEIGLEGCALQVRRPADLLALDFRFKGLNLQVGDGGARIAPGRRGAVGGAGQGVATEYGPSAGYDDRALLIVDFPPQHVAERAYLRQTNDGISLPEPPADDADALAAPDGIATRVRTGGLAARTKARLGERERLSAKRKALPPGDARAQSYDDFLGVQALLTKDGDLATAAWPGSVMPGPASDALLARWNALPIDQRIYLGTDPAVADIDARAVILSIWRAARKAAMNGTGADVGELLGQLPDVTLDPATERSILLRVAADPKNGTALPPGSPGAADQPVVIQAIEAAKEARDNDYALARAAWRATLPDSGLGGSSAFAQYRGRAHVLALHDAGDRATRALLVELVQAVARSLAEDARGNEAFPPITEARLSGPSRLAFRIDGAFTSLADPAQPGPGWIPFTLLGLTRWGGYDLAVVRRAERFYKDAGGRLPAPSLRLAGGDARDILAYQGITAGRAIDGRLADVRSAAATFPGAFETSIELPFRLTLSPSQEGRFRTPQPIPDGVFVPPGRSRIRAPLWTAALEPRVGSPDVRAVASPDFEPRAFDPDGSEPERGPWAPWAREAHGADPGDPPTRFRTALDAYDRHELVGLTSVYGLPVLGRYDANGQITDGSQFAPPPGYRLKGLSTLPGFGDQSAIYRPQPLGVSELRLSSLGGSLNVLTDFVPPASALDRHNRALFPAFSIERWRQRTVLGRDVEVEVVYKGYLYPLGFKASLVKLTERRFALNEGNGRYTAFLIQRIFIRVGERDKTFPALGQPNGSRRFPAKSLTMITTQTPDILDPNGEPPANAGKGIEERPSGVLALPPSAGRARNPGLVFWPRTARGPTGDIGFTFEIEGRADAATMPLIFVDNGAANDAYTLERLADYYNVASATGLRTLQLGGTQRRYAEERRSGEASNETFAWEIRVEGRAGPRAGAPPPVPADPSQNESFVSDALLQGADQPPFYPFVVAADIRVGAAERFVGRPLPRQLVEFHQPYVLNGFRATAEGDPSGDVYLKLRNGPLKLDMGSSGDQGGGLGRVAQDVFWLSRSIGPVGYSGGAAPAAVAPGAVPAAAPASPPPGLGSFFNGDAKLLGIISFGTIRKLASTALPQMTEAVESATEDTAELLRQTVIPRLVKALDALDSAWEKAGAVLKQETAVAGPGATLDIDKVYPDVGPSLKELRQALGEVADADGTAIIALLNRVQESARRFAQAVERTAQDPIAPLREEVRARFRSISQNVEQYADVLSGQLLAALAVAQREARAALKARLAAGVASASDRTRDLLLSLPMIDAAAADAALAAELDQATKSALEALVGALPDAGPIGEAEVARSLRAARAAAQARLVAFADARLDPYVDELKAAADAPERLKGLLFDRLFATGGWVDQVQQAEEALAAAARDAGRDLLERIGAPLKAMLRALLDLEAARRMAAAVASFCDDGAKQVAAFVDQALPKADALSALPEAAYDYGTAIGLRDADRTTLRDRMAATEARYRAARGRVGTATDLSGLCSGLGDPPTAALAQLLESRRSLLLQIAALLATPIAAANPDDARAPLAALLDQIAFVLGAPAAFDASAGPLKALDGLLAKADVPSPPGLLAEAVHQRVAALRASAIGALGGPAKAADGAIRAARTGLAGVATKVEAIRAVLNADLAMAVNDLVAAEQAFASLAGELAASASATSDDVSRLLADAVRTSFALVAVTHAKLTAARHDAYQQLSKAAPDDVSLGLLGLLVQKVLGASVVHLAEVLLVEPKAGGDDKADALTEEDALIRTAATGGDEAALAAAAALADAWATRDPAIVRLGRRIGDVLTAVLRGDLAQFVDLQAIRGEVEAAVRQMLPARIRRSYAFAMGLGDALEQLIDFEGADPQLRLTATGTIDLTKPTAPTFSARGTLPGFTLNLLPDFEVVHLKFAESAFTSESGKPFALSLRVTDVVLGEKVQFLKDLQSYLGAPKDGSGFFLVLMTGRGRPGIAAGYKLALSPITLGDLYISNISLNVAAELPFDDGDARFVISIGRPEAPLVISAFPYAGAGYFGLIANPKGIVGFEASFEFGGGGGFSFGPLTGEGRVTVGIFVRQVSGYTELYGMFFAGGSARIACFCLSASLLMRMSQSGSDLVGQAVFTFSFSIGITDFHYSVTVSKRQAGSGSGKGTSSVRLEGPTRFAAIGLDDATPTRAAPRATVATLSSAARCKGEDWAEHRRYFDPTFHATLL